MGLLLLAEVSTWWPIAPSARKLPVTYTKLPVLDDCRLRRLNPLDSQSAGWLWLTACRHCHADANKHWNGLVRDFYAARVQCYVAQMQRDLPASKPPPSQCSFGTELSKSYLANYPASLVSKPNNAMAANERGDSASR